MYWQISQFLSRYDSAPFCSLIFKQRVVFQHGPLSVMSIENLDRDILEMFSGITVGIPALQCAVCFQQPLHSKMDSVLESLLAGVQSKWTQRQKDRFIWVVQNLTERLKQVFNLSFNSLEHFTLYFLIWILELCQDEFCPENNFQFI